MPAQFRFAAVVIATLSVALAGHSSAVPAPQQSDSSQDTARAKSTLPPEARTDINHATIAELLKVPGMTPSWASRIVRFRPYRTKQDLLDRGVLPSNVYDRIKDYVIAHREKQ